MSKVPPIVSHRRLRSVRRRLSQAVVLAILLSLFTLPANPVTAQPVYVERISGANRYETAVAISRQAFPTGSYHVYIASGENFADSLALGELGTLNGPILLTERDSLPEIVKDEIERLDPLDTIFVLGGPNAVSVAVEEELAALGYVERIAGANRYETALAISRKFNGPAAFYKDAHDWVYLASGENFADALVAANGARGLLTGTGVLLVPPNILPGPVVDEIARLEVDEVILLGGESSISSTVQRELQKQFPRHRISRIAGADRYQTAVEFSRRFHSLVSAEITPGYDVVVASGQNFPDALSAPALGEVLLLTPEHCVPEVVMNEIVRLKPTRITLLGGQRALTSTVESLVSCGGSTPLTNWTDRVATIKRETDWPEPVDLEGFAEFSGYSWDVILVELEVAGTDWIVVSREYEGQIEYTNEELVDFDTMRRNTVLKIAEELERRGWGERRVLDDLFGFSIYVYRTDGDVEQTVQISLSDIHLVQSREVEYVS